MLTYEASAAIIEEYPWLKEHERDLSTCITGEAEYWQRCGAVKDFHEAVDKAHEFMLEWLKCAYEFHVDVDDLADLIKFIVSHRQACVWAVLISRHHQRMS